ncbi:Protein PET10 [Nakaseomyces bracarensis]|uniref:Protein PET10 n=1 Tax=Nakaseomyces bracarensis TaxID=273131 RepID=A0ABR4NMD2_9SACH
MTKNYADAAIEGHEKKEAHDEVRAVLEYVSPSYQHLHQYSPVNKAIDLVTSLPVVAKFIAAAWLGFNSLQQKVKSSGKYPPVLSKLSHGVFGLLRKFDAFVNLVVFTEGVDAFLVALKEHGNKPGFWVLWFLIDYTANIFNIILNQLILKPFKLGNVVLKEKDGETTKTSFKELPHVAELSTTTTRLSKDIQSKVSETYIKPTKDTAKQKYDTYIKPTADKLQSVYVGNAKEKIDTYVKPSYETYVKPKYDTAKETYKTISDTYEKKLNKTESIPRAIVDTGYEVGSITLGRLRVNTPKETSTPQSTEVN